VREITELAKVNIELASEKIARALENLLLVKENIERASENLARAKDFYALTPENLYLTLSLFPSP